MENLYGNWTEELDIDEITDFGDLPVFERATTYPCILGPAERNNPSRNT